VLAGDLGPMQRRGRGAGGEAAAAVPQPAIPVFVAAGQPLASWLKPVAGKPGSFRTVGVGRDRDVDFAPFYSLHRRTYGAYWDLFTPEEWKQRAADILAAQEKQRKLEAATVAFVQPGQMQTERDFSQQGENSRPVQMEGRFGRRGSSWFSFDVPVEPAHSMTLIVTYSRGEEQDRAFEIHVDGARIAEQAVERRSPQERSGFFDVEYKIPAEAVQGKQKVTVRFQAVGGSEIAAVYGIRMIRADAAR